MQDLEQIQKANARASLGTVKSLRDDGYHVVVEYQGLNAVDVHGFATKEEADAKKAEIASQPGGSAAYYGPTVSPLAHSEQQDDALAQQAAKAGVKGFSLVDAPADPGELTVRPVQVAALVFVTNGEVAAVPPHRSQAVFDGDAILALCGPDTDLTSARDANVFAQAFKLRDALRKLVATFDPQTCFDELTDARAVLDAATPVFAKFEQPSAEQQLAAARQGYDPSQNPDTSSILDDTRPSDVN